MCVVVVQPNWVKHVSDMKNQWPTTVYTRIRSDICTWYCTGLNRRANKSSTLRFPRIIDIYYGPIQITLELVKVNIVSRSPISLAGGIEGLIGGSCPQILLSIKQALIQSCVTITTQVYKALLGTSAFTFCGPIYICITTIQPLQPLHSWHYVCVYVCSLAI